MKNVLTLLLLLGISMSIAANPSDRPNGENIRQVVINGSSQHPSVMQPTGFYNLDTHYLTICFPSTDYSNIGIAEAVAKQKYNGGMRNYIISIHNLLGDPNLDMWTSIPSLYSGVTINRGETTLSISGIDSNGRKAIVATYSNDSTIRMVKTDEGMVKFTGIDPNSSVIIYQHNKLPYIAPLVLQNKRIENNQHVIASDLTAGNSVDSNRAQGEVTIASGTNYSVEHTGIVSLQPGFKVEQGATFSVKLSDY